ncbi:SgcJ/EcaC family oxidoreductase [Streptomyces sp. V2]|uniref:SgcJ/EcaC family oxidoreductase n=1 Tax=Streptomyces niveiscabiei TaxID=164115 RepID=A0ABW9I204_9ACTN|nr:MULTISPECIES: SgcJ/EcaC family oxidoreductase [Streptomyces]PWG09105.1 SgcJ/EcaC family oxidoreductase [Streptomyces sp. V2]QZZ29276.1 SgcJ/EcaC family oxidoreductase [Streptomyces sp. ST1015]
MNRRRPRPVSKRALVIGTASLVVAGSIGAGVSFAGPEHKPQSKRATKAQISGLFTTWNATLRTGDAEKVADLYADNAVLLPTVSNKIRTDHAGIVDYFEHFLANKPVGKKLTTIVNVLDDNSAIDTGIYQFTLTDPKTGAKSVVKARYTYEYEKQRDGDWKIVNHHSSKMPEG